MITNGEFVSRVVNGLKALTKDTHVSARYIAHVGKVKANKYLDELCEWTTILATYQCKGLTEEDALIQARVAKILRYEDYDFDLKEVIPEEGGFFVESIKRNSSDIYRVKISESY
jgi:hypothetical protein